MQPDNTLPLRHMTTATAKKLEGLIGMHQDLMYVMRLTHAAIGHLKDNGKKDDGLLLQTYWTAALSAYARPFKDGVRDQQLKLNAKAIFSGIEGTLESHTYFINQRDKLIAHSVNPFEDVYVGVVISPEGKIIGTGELAGRLVSTSQEGLNDLNQLAKLSIKHNNLEIKSVKKQLLAEANAMTSEELKNLATVKFTAPHPDKSGKARKR
jgi:hypothetical protein